MTHLRPPRFWLLTTAALIFGSHMSAAAQSATVFQPGAYNAGAPTMVAAAPSLPNIPADQIARDVAAEFNPRTGRTELIAAPFDPFEEDPHMAGSLRLRSADGAVAINGQPLAGGALVDIDFYYNSPSDDPFGGRNYSDVSFVSGDFAPVVLRDSRILECSTRVDNVVYDHNVYYSPSFSSVGIYQPYRHYAGHSSFGFGFGSSYFGPGIGFFNTNRSRLNRSNSRAFLPRANLPNAGFRRGSVRRGRIISPITPGTAVAGDANNETASTPRAQANTLTPAAAAAARQRRNIRNRISGRRLTSEDFRPDATPAPSSQPVASTTTNTQRTTGRVSRVSPALGGRSILRNETRIAAERQRIQKQNAPKTTIKKPAPKQTVKRSTPKQTTPKRSAPKQSTSKRTTPKSRSSSRSSASSSSRGSSSRLNRSSSRRNSAIRNFFPNDGYGGRHVVTSQSVDCAREDKLSVFIPNDRLDAARFDGLTIIALDAQGGETPIYIPPNYIQGYRLAATGRVQPQGILGTPQSQGSPQIQPQPRFQQHPPFQQQQPRIEAAPCPAGTLKQPDGTCLQTTQGGYPLR